jgi:Uma2 family endonuclease
MGLTVGDRPIHPLTADDVIRMVEAGILGEDDRVELLDGVLTQVSPKSVDHGTVVARLLRWLIASDPDERYEVRAEHPLAVPDRRSLPEPDVAVVDRDARAVGHPTTALLVVEVAISSLRTDLEVKPDLYAAAGVSEYWVIDVPGLRVERFTDPTGGAFAMQSAHQPPERLTPIELEVGPLDLTELFAGLAHR